MGKRKTKSVSFKFMLIEIDNFVEIRDYLKHFKAFQYGVAFFAKTDKGDDVMYVYVKYTRNISLDLSKVNKCRIRKGGPRFDNEVRDWKRIGKVIWEEGKISLEPQEKKQEPIDKFIDVNINISKEDVKVAVDGPKDEAEVKI